MNGHVNVLKQEKMRHKEIRNPAEYFCGKNGTSEKNKGSGLMGQCVTEIKLPFKTCTLIV